MNRTSAATLALLFCLLAPGCRTVESTGEIRAKLSPGSVCLSVPMIVEEGKGSCGLDCTTALLRYHGLELDDEGRRRFPLDEVKKEWISAGELRDYLVFRGFRAHLVHGSLDETRPAGLLRLLDAGIPVMVEREIRGDDHFQIVCGFDPERRLVLVTLVDGTGAVPFDKFEKSWARTGHLMLVAVPENKIAVPPAPAGG